MSQLRRFTCVVLTLLSLSAFAKEQFLHDATPEELAMKSVEMAPGAQAVVLQWDHRQDDFTNWESEYVRIKIFDRAAAKYGDIELPFAPGYSWIKTLEARTIHPDGSVVPFTGKTFDKLIVKASGIKVMARTFSLPDIQPGSILELYYVRAWNPDHLASSHWVVQREIPVLKETIWLRPYTKVYSSFFTYQGLPAGKLPTKVGDHFELALENLPAYDEEPYSPPAMMDKARVDFLYTEGETEPAKYWKKTGDDWTDVIEDFIGKPKGSIKTEATTLTNGLTSDDEKLKKLYERAQKIRNLSYEPDKTEKEESREKLRDNRNADDVLSNGYGWRSEITRLFVALARSAGYTANVVRSATRDDLMFSEKIPDSSQLDTELAVVNAGGKDRFFDPGTPFAPFGIVTWQVTGVPGLKLVKKQTAFVEVPHLTAADAVLSRKADLKIDGDVVKGSVKITYNGERALVRRVSGRNDDEAKNKKTMEDDIKSWLPEGSTVTLKSFGPLKSFDDPLVADFDVEMPNLGSFAGSRVLLPLSIFSESAKNPFSASDRKHDLYWDYERQTEDEVVLHLPDGYNIEALPQGTSSNLQALIFKTTWSKDEHSVTFKRLLQVNTLSIERNYYPQIRSFYKRATAADQENVVLKKAAK
ncbi:MAG TPA: DUF3857 domain-containing protein [Thermoanaerobaculia bacterium]|nr:DUF3857 domain-containing protein [Thermoanaerobaculia bacterium]